MRQDRALWPSTSTVHAPHTPCSQPTCVPVSPSSCRRKSASVTRVSTSRRYPLPLTVSAISFMSGMSVLLSSCRGLFERTVCEHARKVLSVLGSHIGVRDGFELCRFGGCGPECRRHSFLPFERAFDRG